MKDCSATARRILALWLPRLPTDRLKRLPAGAPDDARPCVVVARENNALQIAALNAAAARFGLETGQPLANVRAICPDVQVCDADAAADRALLEAIADWCDRFTPLVALDPPHGLLLDISGCAHLFGGEATMLGGVCSSLDRYGFAVNGAVAGTPACARTLSRAARSCVVPAGGEARAVAALPVFALGADDAVTRGLRRAGLKTIGDVAARPPREIAARFGAAFMDLLRQALGERDAPISPHRPLPDYMAEQRFAEPVSTDAVIASVLSALAGRLVAAMARHGKGARRLEASFFRTDGAVHGIAVEAGQPVTRAAVVERLFRERLAALADPLDPGFGFDLLRLSASHVEIVVQEQRDLDSRVRDNDEVAALVDRLAARLGSGRVVVHLPQDTHIPERVALPVPAQRHLAVALDAAWPARAEAEPPLRPLRMLAPPEPIDVPLATVPDGPPRRFTWRRATHEVARVEGPERVAMEWWRAEGGRLTRDYFRVEDEAGRRFWLYRDGLYDECVNEAGKPVPPKWYMHGLFA